MGPERRAARVSAIASIQLFALAVGAAETLVRLSGGTLWARATDFFIAKGAICVLAWITTALALLTRPPDERSLFFRACMPMLLGGCFLFWLQRMAWRPSDHSVPVAVWFAVTILLIVGSLLLARCGPKRLVLVSPLLVLAYQIGVGPLNVHAPVASLRSMLPVAIAAAGTVIAFYAISRFPFVVPPRVLVFSGAMLAMTALLLFLANTHRSFVEREPAASFRGRVAPPQPNVVLVVIDTLRADRITPNGYDVRDTTPTLARLASTSRLFTKAYASTSWTIPSVATMFTGESPAQHGLLVYGQPLPDRPLLAEILARRGYFTIGVTANQLIDRPSGFTRGFHRFDTLSRLYLQHGPNKAFWTDAIEALQFLQAKGALPRMTHDWSIKARARDVVDTTLEEISRAPDNAPLFVYMHVIDPHRLWDAPSNRVTNGWEIVSADHAFNPASSLEYDREVRTMDAQLGRFFDRISTRLDPRNTLLVVVADHGEQLGERGKEGHGQNLDDAVVSVPLLVRDPSRAAGIEQRPFSLDNLRALMLASDRQAPAAETFGWPIAAYLVAPAQLEQAERSIQWGDWKYVAIDTDGRLTHETLLRLPDEETNRIASEPGIATALRRRVPQATMLQNPGMSPEAAEKLRSLSYIH